MFDHSLVTLYVLTGTGSAAFFGAGYCAGWLRVISRGVARDHEATRVRSALEARVTALEGEIATLTERCSVAEGALDRERAERAAVSARAQALEAEARARDGELQGLREQLAELESAARAHRERAARGPVRVEPVAREQQERLQQQLQLAQREQQRARQEAQQAQQELQRLRGEPSRAQLELTRVQQELAKARQELAQERAARSQREAEAKAQLEQSALRDAELARRSGRIEALEAEQARRDERIRTLERELGAREAGPVSAPSAELLAEVARLQARCQELEARAVTSAARGAGGEAVEVERARAAEQQAVAELERERRARGELAAELEARRAEARRLADDIVALQQRLSEVEGDREDLAVRQAGAAAYVRRAQDEAKRHSERAAKLEAELVELRSIPPLGPSPARVAELEREVALLRSAAATAGREETRELRLRISQLEPRAASADRLEDESARLRDRIEELAREVAETPELRRRLAALEARLFALGERPPALREAPRPEASPDGGPVSTAAELAELTASPTVRCATLADGHGLQVVASGEPEAQEGLAAVTGLAGHLAAQAVQILPLGEVTDVTFRDRNALVVSCRLFDCHGDHMALATLGTGEPPPSQLDRVVATVRRALALPAEEPGSPS